MLQSSLPSGILPQDANIELFADPEKFGKCLFIQYGMTKAFNNLHPAIMSSLYQECFSDKSAVKAMDDLGIHDNDKVEFYNFCNRGALNSEPDINESGKRTTEYFNCGRRGKCIGEGRICKLDIHGTKLTPRELECIRLNNQGYDYSEIQEKMGFNTVTAVNSLMMKCRTKFDAKDKTQLLIKSQQLGII